MDQALRNFVRERAGNQCEYCRLPQSAGASVRFHIEHIRPRQHGGSDDAANLALACPNCNWHKGPNLSGIDPESGEIVPLFNPRQEKWANHFELVGFEILGVTPSGRASVQLLQLNLPERVDVRRVVGFFHSADS